jgi:hypothetical protein
LVNLLIGQIEVLKGHVRKLWQLVVLDEYFQIARCLRSFLPLRVVDREEIILLNLLAFEYQIQVVHDEIVVLYRANFFDGLLEEDFDRLVRHLMKGPANRAHEIQINLNQWLIRVEVRGGHCLPSNEVFLNDLLND